MPPYTTEAAPSAGEQGLPRVVVSAADGASFEAYLHGAHVTSWRVAGSDAERLFVSREARFEDGLAIRGGIPVCFPQFADQGTLPMHGLVRTEPWTLVAAGQARDGAAHARLRIEMAPRLPAWPHAFACDVDVRARARTLTVQAGGTWAVMRVVLPIAACMLGGGFAGRGFVRSWCLGCLAILCWYERLRAVGG